MLAHIFPDSHFIHCIFVSFISHLNPNPPISLSSRSFFTCVRSLCVTDQVHLMPGNGHGLYMLFHTMDVHVHACMHACHYLFERGKECLRLQSYCP